MRAGHAPLEDLKDDKDLGRILLHFHRAQRPTAIICHAPIALLSAKQARPLAWCGQACHTCRHSFVLRLVPWQHWLPVHAEENLQGCCEEFMLKCLCTFNAGRGTGLLCQCNACVLPMVGQVRALRGKVD